MSDNAPSSEPPSDPQLPPFVVCLRCGAQAEPTAHICPRCGSILPPPKSAAWPLPPGEKMTPSVARWMRRFEHEDEGTGLGCGLGCLAIPLSIVGFGLIPGWILRVAPMTMSDKMENVIGATVSLMILGGVYVLLRRKFPGIAWGFGYVLILTALMLLGMTAICTR